MKTLLCCAVSLLLIGQVAPALSYQPQQFVERREAFGRVLAGSAAAFFLASSLPANSAAAAVLRSKGCYQGEGEACAEFSADNDLIKSLQEKSAANREKNEKVRMMYDMFTVMRFRSILFTLSLRDGVHYTV